MKAKFIKRLTAGFVSAIMAVGMMGVTAFAAEITVSNETENLQKVINDAEDGDTIKFTSDIELTETLVIENGKDITLDLEGYKLSIDEDKTDISEANYVIRFGEENNDDNANTGRLEIKDGTINCVKPIFNCGGELILGEDLVVNSKTGAVRSYGGKVIVDGAELHAVGNPHDPDDDDDDEAAYTVALFNVGKDNKKSSTEFEMIDGLITVDFGIAISGNNTTSAGTKVTIKDGTIEATPEDTAIYWPMEGELTITGGTIKGGTGIEAKMGTITISRDAEIVGTGKHSETSPISGGTSPDGSAILISAQKYGPGSAQYVNSPNLDVSIEGGTIKSNEGNAVTVYNVEEVSGQEANISIEGGEISGDKADIKYISDETKTENAVSTSVDDNSYKTSKSQTTLTVSSDAAPAAINEKGNVVFYRDVNEAIEKANSEEEVTVTVFGDINDDVQLKDNVKLAVADGVTMNGVVTAADGKVLTVSTIDGTTTYSSVDSVMDIDDYLVEITSKDGSKAYCQTLGQAVDNVKNGDIIKLLGNCNETVVVKKDVSFYVDDNGFDYDIVAGNGYVNVGRGDDYDFITKEDYEDERDSHRHSYSLKEGKTERDDEEEEPVVTPEPEEEEGPFSDVGKDNPNYDAIVEVYEKGWMAGIGDGVFAPNGTLTRGMAVTILWNRAGQPEPASVAPFLDVTSDAWYAKAVAWAYENGITSGYGDTYGPDDFLTTEQFTRMNDIANGRTPEVYVGGAPNATRGWVAGLLVME